MPRLRISGLNETLEVIWLDFPHSSGVELPDLPIKKKKKPEHPIKLEFQINNTF